MKLLVEGFSKFLEEAPGGPPVLDRNTALDAEVDVTYQQNQEEEERLASEQQIRDDVAALQEFVADGKKVLQLGMGSSSWPEHKELVKSLQRVVLWQLAVDRSAASRVAESEMGETIDGVFGKGTKKGVTRVQEIIGAHPDGKAGRQTISKLLGDGSGQMSDRRPDADDNSAGVESDLVVQADIDNAMDDLLHCPAGYHQDGDECVEITGNEPDDDSGDAPMYTELTDDLGNVWVKGGDAWQTDSSTGINYDETLWDSLIVWKDGPNEVMGPRGDSSWYVVNGEQHSANVRDLARDSDDPLVRTTYQELEDIAAANDTIEESTSRWETLAGILKD